MAQAPQDLVIRPLREDERLYVLVSWRDSYHDHHSDHICPRDKIKRCWGCGVIDRLLDKSEVLVACHRDSPDVVLGYVVFQSAPDGALVIHYCHVKRAFQRLGIATALIDAATSAPHSHVEYTHETHFMRFIFRTDWRPAKWRLLLS